MVFVTTQVRYSLLLCAISLCALPWVFPAKAQAAASYQLTQPNVIAIVDDWVIPYRSYQLFSTALKQSTRADLKPPALLKEIIINALLQRKNSPSSAFKVRHNTTAYLRVLTLNTAKQVPAHAPKIDYFSPEKSTISRSLTANDAVVWAKATLTTGETLDVRSADILSVMHAHQRIPLSAMTNPQIQQKIQVVVDRWADMISREQALTLPANVADALKQMVFDLQFKQYYMRDYGVISELHKSEPALNKLAKTIQQSQVDAYYQTHQNQYSQVQSVQARHIFMRSQQQADFVYAQLNNGVDFAQAVKQWSQAADKSLPIAGSLGTIQRTTSGLRLVEKIALIPAQGHYSKPYRTRDGWEIVMVDQRQQAVLPLTDKSVQFEIRRTLARISIRKAWDAMVEQLLKQAHIEINPTLFRGRIE